jgi:tRNA pseudouridine38-40 synthase
VLAFDVVGNAFLHNMVRIIVGSLLDVGRGRLGREALARARDGGRRTDLGMTAPAWGLYLESIDHALALESEWPPRG